MKCAVGIVLTMCLFVMLFSSTIYATPDATPPADWDIGTGEYLRAAMNEVSGGVGEWEILFPINQYDDASYEFQNEEYCVGIIRYETMAASGVANPATGWAYGYWARKKPEDLSYCYDFRSYMSNNAEAGPGVLFLHGNNSRGSFANAAKIAYMTSKNLAGNPVFALSISAPGQGYDCVGDDDAEDADTNECAAYSIEDQIGVGNSMDLPTIWAQGFEDDYTIPNPDYSLLWNYANSAMRAVNLFDIVFDDEDNGGILGFTNGALIIGGESAGGLTSLIVNGVDNRHDGVFTMAASGSLETAVKHPGSWMAFLVTADTYQDTYNPDFSFDCNNLDSNDDLYEKEWAACRMMDYFEPLAFTPQKPILLTAGASDEVFPINSQRATYYYYDNLYSQPVYRHVQGDMDHAFYWLPNKMIALSHPLSYDDEAYGAIDPDDYLFSWSSGDYTYGYNRLYDSIGAFCGNIFNGSSTTYYQQPVSTTITRTVTSTYKMYSVKACWNNTVTPQPDANKVLFNVSIDEYFHILPACSGESYGSSQYGIYYQPGVYVFPGTTNYSYPTTVDSCDNEGNCPLGQVDSTYNGLFGHSASSSNSYETCRQLDVVFYNTAGEPYNFSAWVDLVYDYTGTGRYATSSGSVVSYINHSQASNPTVCMRREDNRFFSPRWGTGNEFDYMTSYWDDESKKSVSETDRGDCEEKIIEGEYWLGDGENMVWNDRTIVFAANSKLVLEGSAVIQTNCDIIFEEGSTIEYSIHNEATNGSLVLASDNIFLGGDIFSESYGKAIELIALTDGDLYVVGNLNITGVDKSGLGGVFKLFVGGNLKLLGNLDVSADYSSGAVDAKVGGDIYMSGSIYGNGEEPYSVGGAIRLDAGGILTLTDQALISATGSLIEGRVALYSGEGTDDQGAMIDADIVNGLDDSPLPGLEDITTPTASINKKVQTIAR